MKAFITGIAGTELTADEAHLLASEKPAGIILFTRNCQSHDQIRRLVADVRTASGEDDLLVLIDQEGGRVQRLRPPLGRALPPASAYGDRYDRNPTAAIELTRDIARLVAADLRDLGINTDCAPVLDLPAAGSHAIIGDRAFGTETERVARLGGAFADGLLAGGVLPVIKHIPGHGRATADSHHELPVVTTPLAELSRTDFATFKASTRFPAAMTAHVVYTALDDVLPASVSAQVHQRVIRGEIGFDGLLMSDDLNMHALHGSLRERTEAVIRAGSDIALHCNGNLEQMREVAAASPRLDGRALHRFRAAVDATRSESVLPHHEQMRIAAVLDDVLAERPGCSEASRGKASGPESV